MKIQRILCPIDFSEPSRAALREGTALARQFGAVLELLHVYQIPGYTLPDGVIFPGPEAMNQLFERIDQSLLEWRREAERLGVKLVETRTVQGVPWQEIVDSAEKGRCDLIVIGTHGHTGIKHFLLGSVAERVVRHANCPVLTVREEATAHPQPEAIP